MIIGGMMIPANMESACWKPRTNAKTMGILPFSPKKGAARRAFVIVAEETLSWQCAEGRE
jgi:hypothetical protein